MGVPCGAGRGHPSAGYITAAMCGQAYLTRSQIPEILKPFAGNKKNVEPFLEVIKEHCQAAVSLSWEGVQLDH